MQLLRGLAASLIYFVSSTGPAVIGGGADDLTGGEGGHHPVCLELQNFWLSCTPSPDSQEIRLGRQDVMRIISKHAYFCVHMQTWFHYGFQ